MQLSRKNLLYRWAYILDETKPKQTNVCSLFWRAFLGVPLALPFLLVFLVVIALAYPIILLMDRIENRKEPGIIRQRISDWKDKTCTRIEIT